MLGPGDIVGERFTVEREAGRGATGVVYRAHDGRTGEAVALKLMRRDAPVDVHRFSREALVLTGLHHPRIVRYVDHGNAPDGAPWLATEWIEGQSLAERLAAGSLTIAEAVELALHVAEALAAAHRQGIVHRDVKPGNLLLAGASLEGVKVVDFGIARLGGRRSKLTSAGEMVGTPQFMAPEQARGDPDVDTRADVFALGCVLYECLTGHAAFGGADIVAVLAKILFDQPASPRQLRPDVSPALEALVLRMLAKDAAARPASGEQVAAALRLLDERRSAAHPATPGSTAGPDDPSLPFLTRAERRVVTVVLARGPDVDEPDFRRALAELVVAHDARLEILANGSIAAALAGTGAATDQAARAARFALSLRALAPSARLVLATGRTTLGASSVVGDAIDRAARMLAESRARDAPGIVRVDEATTGLLDVRFDVGSDAGGLRLDGEREAAAPEGAARPLLGRITTCVGRERELAALDALFAECAGEPVARVALLTGPPGSGKSRVRYELLRRLRQNDPRIQILVARGEPLSAGSPFGMLAPALRRAAGVLDGEPIDARRRKLRARVARNMGPALSVVDLERITGLIGELAKVPFPDDQSDALRAARQDATTMGDAMRAAWVDWLDAECGAAPLVLVLEDLQWGDMPTVQFVDAALRVLRARPLLVLGLGRPEVDTLFPGTWEGRDLLRLRLGPLSARASERLVREALGAGAPAERVARVVERAAGNAFYLEELVRAVASSRDDDLPDTVLGMVQARLDALGAGARLALRAASVFGRRFRRDGVTALTAEERRGATDSALQDLAGAELVMRVTAAAPGGDAEYAFRDALVRDTAYATLTDADRELGHRLAAAWLESAGEPDPIVLAEHFERGAEPARAVSWLRRGAEQALEAGDFAAALARAERGVECGASGETLGMLRLVQAEALRWRGDFVEAVERATDALDLLPRGATAWFRASDEIMSAAGRVGQYRSARSWALKPDGIAPLDDTAATARLICLCSAARQLFHAGRYFLAEQLERRILGMAGDLSRLDPRAAAQIHRLRGARARHVGDMAGDLAGYTAALHAFEQASDARNVCNTRVSLGFAYVQVADFDRAETELRQALAQAERLGLETIATRAQQNLGLVLAERGETEAARALEVRVIEESRAQGNRRFEGWTRVYLSTIACRAGDLETAEAEARRAMVVLEVTPPARAGAQAALSAALLRAGRTDEALVQAAEAMAVLESFGGIEEFEPLIRLAYAEASHAAGREDAARSAIATARDRLHACAAAIADPGWREGFLHRVRVNARILALAAEWLGLPPTPEIHMPRDTRSDTPRDDASDRISAAWDPETFRTEGHALVDRLADYLARAIRGHEIPVVAWRDPEVMAARWPAAFGESPRESLGPLVERVLADSVHQHHPHYMGYQVTPPLPAAALLDLAAAVLNNGMAAYDAGPASTAMERAVVSWMAGRLGWDARAGGVLTSGGTAGNLTALLAARQATAGFDAWGDGAAAGPPLCALTSAQAHYSVSRAVQIMGWGRDGCVAVPVDARFRLRPDALDEARAAAERAGRRVVAVIANAGSTSTGAFDPFGPIADWCAARGVWLHVDGAHGASAVLSERHRHLLAGVERADSVVWDAHKMLALPALVTGVLFRDGQASYGAFAQSAEYLFAAGEGRERWFDVGLRTLECTKRMMSLKTYGALTVLGTRVLGDYVARSFDLAARFAELLRATPDFELAVEPDCNIVCFRHLPAGAEPAALDRLQDEIRRRIHATGAFFITRTQLPSGVHLRTTLMNPFTTEKDLTELMEAVRSAARETTR